MKKKSEPHHDDDELLEDSEPRPLMASRPNLPKLFKGMEAQSWANLAAAGEGPPYYRRGKLCWYIVADVQAYLMKNPVKTSEGE